jgi:hypothetical protein
LEYGSPREAAEAVHRQLSHKGYVDPQTRSGDTEVRVTIAQETTVGDVLEGIEERYGTEDELELTGRRTLGVGTPVSRCTTIAATIPKSR